MKKNLAGEWSFRATDKNNFLPAIVPGCQYLDLFRNGIIPDPYVGTNESAVQWVHDKDYLYQKTFLLDYEIKAENAILVLNKVDTVAEIILNGQKVGYVDNCHLEYTFPVKEYLKKGENELSITFFSPKKYVEKKHREVPTPINSNGQNGIVHIRKTQCHFGWDWGPVLIPVGLAGKIYLDFYDGKTLGDLNIRTKKEGSSYRVSVKCENAEKIRLTDPDGVVTEKNGEENEFVIDNPQEWWTKELSGKETQPLYTVEAITGENVKSKKIGLRTIELNRDKDEYGYNFRFFLNGVPLFIKGANYIPSDCFTTRFDKKKLDDLLDAVIFSNMNMIRVWGGGYYADDELLNECDRRGILIWQDFQFACQAYPFFDEEFLSNVLKEVKYNVKRISSHPCLAVWCGNNEIETMHLAWATMHKYVVWTEKFFYDILPKNIRLYDEDTPYTPGSPIGTAHNKDVNADFVGDTHLWGVWHGLQPMNHYRKRMTRFCSEFGFESLPSFFTVSSYADPEEYPLSSKVQKSHQKCVGGNDKMLKYIADRFPLSEDIKDLIYLSQATQATCIADATEHWRRNKGRCNGAMYWQLNDCWPTCSWSSYDYYGVYKALLYAGKDFFRPLSVSIKDTKKQINIYLINDLTTEKNVDIEWIKFDFTGKNVTKTRKSFAAKPLANEIVFTLPVADVDKKTEGIAVRLYIDNECVQQKTLLLSAEKKLLLPKEKISVTESIENNRRKITLQSDVYQRLVMLECGNNNFSDNFFDLLPNETKTVYLDDTVSPVEIKTITDIKPVGLIKTLKAKLKVYFSARNIGNMLYHAKVPKEKRG